MGKVTYSETRKETTEETQDRNSIDYKEDIWATRENEGRNIHACSAVQVIHRVLQRNTIVYILGTESSSWNISGWCPKPKTPVPSGIRYARRRCQERSRTWHAQAQRQPLADINTTEVNPISNKIFSSSEDTSGYHILASMKCERWRARERQYLRSRCINGRRKTTSEYLRKIVPKTTLYIIKIEQRECLKSANSWYSKLLRLDEKTSY